MPSTITSTLVAGVLDGSITLPVVPGRVMCTTATKTVFSATQSITAGQIIQMVPIPTGSRILDVVVRSSFPAASDAAFGVGDGSSTSRYIVAASLSTSKVNRMNAGLGFKYSLSDDIQNPLLRFDTIDVSFGAGVTQTFTGSMMLQVYWVYEKET